jgi:small GTP-binding protein
MTMDELQPGQSAYITAVGGEGALRHHLLDMGLTPGTEVTLQKIAPMGDPVQMKVRGYELTLRLSEAQKIDVDHVHEKETEAPKQTVRYESIEHPGVGELGQADPTHVHDEKTAVPKGGKLTFALAGNQNCGKTTLFNQLTGANQHVGNFPGVTVDRKDGTIRNHPEATVTDLPGIYSLSPYSSEEIVTREFLIEGKPSGIINIVDASNLERNLCLTMQLMELGIPMVLALNMMDEVRANGGTIRVNELEQILGIPVVPISAAKNEGIDELVSHAMHVARYHEPPGRIDFCPDSKDDNQFQLYRQTNAVGKQTNTFLDLEVLDISTGKRRPVGNLSGGESFKASLSLALGLSDTIAENRGGIQMDALFVDEGFGTLDSKSLEETKDALLSMSGENKLVGIISHRDELMDIPQKLRVTKGRGGSRIQMEL